MDTLRHEALATSFPEAVQLGSDSPTIHKPDAIVQDDVRDTCRYHASPGLERGGPQEERRRDSAGTHARSRALPLPEDRLRAMIPMRFTSDRDVRLAGYGAPGDGPS